MQRLRPPAAIAAGALALWLVLPSYLNYDTAWSLVWGGQLADGGAPRLDALSAPTPHPLGTLLGVLLAPLGAAAGDAATLLVLGSVAAVVWLAFALGRQWFGAAAGWIAAALALTAVPLLTPAARAYLDVPYLALVLGALLVETRRRHAGTPVLALLAVAGLWRPEAWLFSAAYWVWTARGRPRAEIVWLAVLAAAAPAAWLLGDLLLAGDPLHSFTWTREQAAALGRARGPGALRTALPDKLAHAAGLPVLVAGTAGLALLLRQRPHAGGGLAAAALGAALATAAALTAAGMPVVERYLLLPLLLLIVLAAGVAAEARARPAAPVALAGAAVAVLLVGSAPSRLGAVLTRRDDLAVQATLRADLRALAERGAVPRRCAGVVASTHKLIPLLALWTGRAPANFDAGGPARAYVAPATTAVQRTLLLAPSDPREAALSPPAGAVEVARNSAWRVEARC
jgi:hypothetical protein